MSYLVYVEVTNYPDPEVHSEEAGLYGISLSEEDVPFEHRANAALDVFHANIPIDVLDEFTFQVMDEDRNAISEADDVESYQYSDAGSVLSFTPKFTPPSPTGTM